MRVVLRRRTIFAAAPLCSPWSSVSGGLGPKLDAVEEKMLALSAIGSAGQHGAGARRDAARNLFAVSARHRIRPKGEQSLRGRFSWPNRTPARDSRFIRVRCGTWPSAPTARRWPPAGEDETVILWDVASRQPLGEPLKGHQGAVSERGLQPRRQDARLRELRTAP